MLHLLSIISTDAMICRKPDKTISMLDQKMKLTKGTQTVLVPRFAINFVTKNDFSNSTGP